MAGPIVTANQVTFVRLLMLPLGCWLLYQPGWGPWVALFFMTVVGCTDFVDGWLARKYGPTLLGGLMDPIADKIFIVVVFLPFIDLGWLPAWLVALLFLREFLITGLRSAYERRGLKLKSTLLAQIKTWVQMGGAAVLFLLNIVESFWTMVLVLAAGVVLPFLFIGVRYLVRGYFWAKALVFSAWFGGTLLAYMAFGAATASTLLMLSMLAVTWITGWGYIARSGQLLSVRPLDQSDLVRIGSSLVIPLVVVLAQAQGRLHPALLILTLSQEMAVGGLDNLLCHHHAQSSAAAWGSRVALTVILLLGAVVLVDAGMARAGALLMVGAWAVSLIGTIYEFIRGRSYYLDAKMQAKPL
jgi:CDP-diacylglycerol--glycerol-3-phosphate 3-phosphatidyltransferase